jgi:hypothetical protein
MNDGRSTEKEQSEKLRAVFDAFVDWFKTQSLKDLFGWVVFAFLVYYALVSIGVFEDYWSMKNIAIREAAGMLK